MTPPEIHRVATLDLKVNRSHGRSRQTGAARSTRILTKVAQKPEIWNGRVLLGRNAVHRRTA